MLATSSPLTAPPATDAERRERERADSQGIPYVLMRDDVNLQRIVQLEGPRVQIGRAEETTLPIPWDASISRMHATLEQDPTGAWWIVDDGRALNGTFVNRTRVRDRTRLADGDVLQLGDTTLAFRAPRA